MNFVTKQVVKHVWVQVQKALRSYGKVTHFDFANNYLENKIMFQMVAKGYDATHGHFLFSIAYHLNSFHQDLSLNDIEIHANIADKWYGVEKSDKYVLSFNNLTDATGQKIARGLIKHLKIFLKRPRQKEGNTMSNLREKLVKLANDNPDGIREHLVPLLKSAECADPGNKTKSKGKGKGDANGDANGDGPVGEPKEASMAKQAGYTHYLEYQTTPEHHWTEPFTDQEWSKIIRVTKQIIGKAKKDGIIIRNGMGTGSPILTNKEILINGDRSTDDQYEGFLVSKYPTEQNEFCKTEQRPYDAVIVSILAAIKKIAPKSVRVSSDGGSSAIKRIYAGGETILGSYEKMMNDMAKTIITKMHTPVKILSIEVRIPRLYIHTKVDIVKITLGVFPNYDNNTVNLTAFGKYVDEKVKLSTQAATSLNIAKFFDKALEG